MTIENLARLAVDQHGDQERQGWQLERLLRHAGWVDPPAFDGFSRVAWLSEVMENRRTDPEDIERFVKRLCDPLEYGGSEETAEGFRLEINSLLNAEHLKVAYIGGRPVIGELRGEGLDGDPVFGVPERFESRLARLLEDVDIVRLLADRAEQSQLAGEAGAHLLALFGIGSVAEGLLLSVLTQREPNLELKRRDGKRVSPENAGLEVLLDAGHQYGHIQLDAKAFMQPVRNFRNYIHPRRQAAEEFVPDRETVKLSWGSLHATLSDLEQSRRPNASGPEPEGHKNRV